MTHRSKFVVRKRIKQVTDATTCRESPKSVLTGGKKGLGNVARLRFNNSLFATRSTYSTTPVEPMLPPDSTSVVVSRMMTCCWATACLPWSPQQVIHTIEPNMCSYERAPGNRVWQIELTVGILHEGESTPRFAELALADFFRVACVCADNIMAARRTNSSFASLPLIRCDASGTAEIVRPFSVAQLHRYRAIKIAFPNAAKRSCSYNPRVNNWSDINPFFERALGSQAGS